VYGWTDNVMGDSLIGQTNFRMRSTPSVSFTT
jgi:hypothetical protein